MKAKLCERCHLPAVEGERFCCGHRKAVMQEMEESGYLTPWPKGQARLEEPWTGPSICDAIWDNAVRSLEDAA